MSFTSDYTNLELYFIVISILGLIMAFSLLYLNSKHKLNLNKPEKIRFKHENQIKPYINTKIDLNEENILTV